MAMFLFTSPAAPATSPGDGVVEAIRRGAAETGADFDYLLRTAERESALDPRARAPTSSATGLFQFIEQTWLGMVRKEGARFGLDAEAQAITRGADGRYAVSDPGQRNAILSLREDPMIAAKLAGALTDSNHAQLARSLGREPRPADLYIAHFLGAGAAADLIDTAQRDPGRNAAAMFPEAARANQRIFYDASGNPRGAGAVYHMLAAQHENIGRAARGDTPAAYAAAPADGDGAPRLPFQDMTGPAFHGLFGSGNRPAGVSEAVSGLWAGEGRSGGSRRPAANGSAGADPASAPRAPLFFPYGDRVSRHGAGASTGTPGSAGEPAPGIPLPPPRPDPTRAGGPDGPLDLQVFTSRRGS
jgi:hypothetical protein